MEDDMITSAQTPEELAAEEAAFESGFNDARGIEVEEEPAPAAKVEEEPAPAAKVEEEPAPAAKVEEEPTPAAKPLTIAGLTEEQIAQALSRIGTMQSTIDKMAGRNGQLMQQIEQLRSSIPQNASQQQAFDLKLERLSEQFPELAKLLQEDLRAAVPAAGAPAPAATPALTPEALEAAISQRLAPIQEQIEVKVLSIVHPDWQDVISTPEFALYRDNVLPAGEGQKLMESEDAGFISNGLTAFKRWRDSTRATPAQVPAAIAPATAPAPTPAARRLAAAVRPTGAAPAPQTAAVTEEDGFLAGFNAERKRTGR